MRGTKAILGGALLLTAAYATTPYFTLWRLYGALCGGNTEALAGMVDWQAVRAGVKQDIDDGIIGMSQPQLVASNGLPPFGAGFVSGIAGNEVDRELTPERIEVAARSLSTLEATPVAQPPRGGLHAIEHAFFDSPRGFELRLRPPGCDPDDPPLRVRLELQGITWRVVRVWVPQEIVERMQSRT
jgi:hypothetical protein